MQDLRDLELMLTSEIPILYVETLEEPRVIQLLTRLGIKLGLAMFQWTLTEGIKHLETDRVAHPDTVQPDAALRVIRLEARPGCYVLLDFHPFIDNPLHVRLIKEIAQNFEQYRTKLIFVSYNPAMPPEVAHLAARFRLALPDRAVLIQLIKEEAQRWQERNRNLPVRADRQAVERLANNLLGVSVSDARRLIRAAIHNDGAITQEDLPEVMKAKYALLSSDGVISFEYSTSQFADMAGLRNLKAWLQRRRAAFEGRLTSLDRPRGILLLGVQGCGKSLAAKAVAGTFAVPLLRLDFGTLYNKYYGETERNLRHALATATVMAPCVLWIDEIEKGISQDRGDEGVSGRVLATLLTWMAENTQAVFIAATANDIQKLPPELIRKGRLDEIFFVDLPDVDERRQIFEIHLRRRNQAPRAFDLEALAAASEGFSGAGIEQVVVAALYAAQAVNMPLDGQYVLHELASTQPLSVVMEEKIQHLRDWARERTVPAH